jgi:hypothetical protein
MIGAKSVIFNHGVNNFVYAVYVHLGKLEGRLRFFFTVSGKLKSYCSHGGIFPGSTCNYLPYYYLLSVHCIKVFVKDATCSWFCTLIN